MLIAIKRKVHEGHQYSQPAHVTTDLPNDEVVYYDCHTGLLEDEDDDENQSGLLEDEEEDDENLYFDPLEKLPPQALR